MFYVGLSSQQVENEEKTGKGFVFSAQMTDPDWRRTAW